MIVPRKDHEPHPIDVYVGGRMRLRRIQLGLSQGALASKIGVSFQAVQKYESGENRLAVGRLAKAAKVLEKPVSYFFTEEPALGGVVGLTPQEAELIRNFRGIERAELRETFLKLARQVTELHGERRE